jgi:exodeoxyribonuclease V gamma subunit
VLHVHRAERADGLVEALAALLADPLPDPFAAEIVSVPTRGMERWLTQRMSTRLGAMPGRSDGVCANIEFPFPHRLVTDAIAAASGVEPEKDPWQPQRLVWPLLEVVDECLSEPWLRDLAAHLGGDPATADPVRRARRLSRVRQLAELFDRYALYRPDMVRGWVEGADADVWQAELWRRLRERVAQLSPAERLERACARLREDPAAVELPHRLSLFGLTRIPAGHLQVLTALAGGRDVHLFLLHPSPALWERPHGPVILRRDDTTADSVRNRLLASWGQDAREMQLVLANAGEQVAHHHPVEHAADTLLARIQADVRADRSPPGAPLPGRDDERPPLDPGDRSLRVHACHGRARQVDVLRDAILHELAADPSLEPRDVIVMCPDIETFAPLIQATFGAGDEELPDDIRPADLRVRLADRSLRQTNPVLGVVAELMELAGQRLTASRVLDLADREPVRRRFRFDDDDLSRIRDWVSRSGIRWGLDAAHRAPFKLEIAAGTWRFGLDRVLTGVTMTEDEQRLFAGVLPLDDVESGAIDLAGRLAELVDRLHTALDALSAPKTIDGWAQAIAAAADALTTTAPRDAWQRAELQRLLDAVVEEAAGSSAEIAPAELRALLADRLRGRPTRANFRTGHLTVCTLVPMRSVPHRVVCLLGLDDGAFPRRAPRDGDDLTLDEPRVGERDPRSEDRQMLLDALLAATDRLIVTYSGNDERTNALLPPAVPVGELLDVVDATVGVDGGSARDQVVVRHPLQPFDPRNFAPGALARGRSWSFDPVTLAGARALEGPRAERAPFLPGPLAAPDPGLVEVEDLVRFAQHPVRAFLRQRLGIGLGDFADEIEDELRVELDGLAKWGVGDRLLQARLAGVDGRSAILAEIARGTLPPGVLGEPVVDEVFPVVDAIVSAADGAVAAESLDVRVELPDGRRLSGTIPGVAGDVLRTVTYSRVAAKQRITAWVRLLALVAAHSDRSLSAVTVGRSSGDGVAIARIAPEGGREWALDRLATLVDLYDRGMREPLPLYCRTSAAYAAGGESAARGEWASEWNYPKEDAEREHVLVLGGVRPFDDLLADERFGRYARQLWEGLLAVEDFR